MAPRTADLLPLILVKVATRGIAKFNMSYPVEPYAALSLAVWTENEDDPQEASNHRRQLATSVEMACILAAGQGYKWLWVDSVQYDWARRNGAKQAEAINSIVYFYNLAEICFVHLADLLPRASLKGDKSWTTCAWFHELFALPAILASKTITFYDQIGKERGDTTSPEFQSMLINLTRPPRELLKDAVMRPATIFPSLCSFRKFAIVRSKFLDEPLSANYLYLLASLFDVQQPQPSKDKDPLIQLQYEIVRAKAGDLSLLAWEDSASQLKFHGVFSDSLFRFEAEPTQTVLATYPFDELEVCVPKWNHTWSVSALCHGEEAQFIMELGRRESGERVGIRLREDDGGASVRVPPYVLEKIPDHQEGSKRTVLLKMIARPKRSHAESPPREEQRAKQHRSAKSTSAKGSKQPENCPKQDIVLAKKSTRTASVRSSDSRDQETSTDPPPPSTPKPGTSKPGEKSSRQGDRRRRREKGEKTSESSKDSIDQVKPIFSGRGSNGPAH